MWKKILAIVCVMVSLTAVLCACDEDDGGGSGGGSRVSTENEYVLSGKPERRKKELALTVTHLYWEEDELHMEMALVCDTNNTAHDIILEELVLENMSGIVIAKAHDLELEDVTVEPGDTVYWDYCFDEDEIVTPGANLRSLKTDFSYKYSH